MTDDERRFYANPPMESVLRAVPMLQWRICYACERVSLYRDNILPACMCDACGSADTRPMTEANKVLHRTDEPPGSDKPKVNQ